MSLTTFRSLLNCNAVFDDNATTKTQLRASMLEQLSDSPTVELTTNYLGSDDDKHYIGNDASLPI